jgi:hypothetical protein
VRPRDVATIEAGFAEVDDATRRPHHEDRDLQRQRHHEPLAARARMARRGKPDIACLQELKTSDDTFPRLEIEAAGYSAVWHGQKGFNGVAVLAARRRRSHRAATRPARRSGRHAQPLPRGGGAWRRRRLDLPAQRQSAAGPKFAYKLAWFERLIEHAASLIGLPEPVLLVGDYNVVATDGVGDIYNPASWRKDALLQPETPRRVPAPPRPRLDRRDPRAARRRADLHVLGLLPRPLLARRGPAHRPPAAQCPGPQTPGPGRRRPCRARTREAERPRAGVGGARLKR